MSVFLLLHLHSSVHVLVQKAQVLDCVRSAILSSQLCQLLVCNMMRFALPRYLFVKVIGHIIWAQKGIVLKELFCPIETLTICEETFDMRVEKARKTAHGMETNSDGGWQFEPKDSGGTVGGLGEWSLVNTPA